MWEYKHQRSQDSGGWGGIAQCAIQRALSTLQPSPALPCERLKEFSPWLEVPGNNSKLGSGQQWEEDKNWVMNVPQPRQHCCTVLDGCVQPRVAFHMA